VCVFLVGFLRERFRSLASELAHCVGNRSGRNWESTAEELCAPVVLKQSETASEARQASLKMRREGQGEAASF